MNKQLKRGVLLSFLTLGLVISPKIAAAETYTKDNTLEITDQEVCRRYNVFRINVSYTDQYDLFNKHSNRYMRTVSTKHNSVEEQHRLVY